MPNRRSFSYTPPHSDTINWQSRVNAVGGRINAKTLAHTDRLIKYCYATGLRDITGVNHKLKFWLPLATDGFEGLFIPIWHPSQNVTCTNNNIVASDYSLASGIQFDGATKYIDSLVNGTLFGESVYLGCHSSTELTSDTFALGAADFTLPYKMIAMVIQWSSGYASYSNRTINSLAALIPSSVGFFAYFTSEGFNYIYRNENQLATNAFGANPPSAPNFNIFLGARNDNGNASSFSSRRLCCFFLGENITPAQHQSFSAQNMIWHMAVRT